MRYDATLDPRTATCRNCTRTYNFTTHVITHGNRFAEFLSDNQYCQGCVRAHWKGIFWASGVWLTAELIWLGLRIVGVVG